LTPVDSIIVDNDDGDAEARHTGTGTLQQQQTTATRPRRTDLPTTVGYAEDIRRPSDWKTTTKSHFTAIHNVNKHTRTSQRQHRPATGLHESLLLLLAGRRCARTAARMLITQPGRPAAGRGCSRENCTQWRT